MTKTAIKSQTPKVVASQATKAAKLSPAPAAETATKATAGAKSSEAAIGRTAKGKAAPPSPTAKAIKSETAATARNVLAAQAATAAPAKTPGRNATPASQATAPPSPPPQPAPEPPPIAGSLPTPQGKLGVLVELMRQPGGVSVYDMAEATGWQIHSVRGALAGALRHRGFVIVSDKPDQMRLYRIIEPEPQAPARAKRNRRSGQAR